MDYEAINKMKVTDLKDFLRLGNYQSGKSEIFTSNHHRISQIKVWVKSSHDTCLIFFFLAKAVRDIAGNVGRHVRSHVRMLAHMQIDLHMRHITRASCCYFKVDRTCKKNLFYNDIYIIF